MDKYAKGILTYGLDTQTQIQKLKVLIIGLKGVSVEICKNLVLLGVGNLTL